MALVTRRAAPTLEDARRAAQALVDVGVGVGGALSDRAVQQHKARIEMRERVRGALSVGQRGSGTRHAFQSTSGIDDHGHMVIRTSSRRPPRRDSLVLNVPRLNSTSILSSQAAAPSSVCAQMLP